MFLKMQNGMVQLCAYWNFPLFYACLQSKTGSFLFSELIQILTTLSGHVVLQEVPPVNRETLLYSLPFNTPVSKLTHHFYSFQ